VRPLSGPIVASQPQTVPGRSLAAGTRPLAKTDRAQSSGSGSGGLAAGPRGCPSASGSSEAEPKRPKRVRRALEWCFSAATQQLGRPLVLRAGGQKFGATGAILFPPKDT